MLDHHSNWTRALAHSPPAYRIGSCCTDSLSKLFWLASVLLLCAGTLSPARAQAPLQINCGGPAVTPFVADEDFSTPSSTNSTTATIDTSGVTNPAPMACYQTQRLSTNPTALTYTLSFGPPGNTAYTLRLHFAELTFNSAGSRTFNVLVNGANWLNNFDIFAAAGNAKNKAVVETRTVHSDSNGTIKITFLPVVNNPTVNAIELLNPTTVVLGNDHPLPAWAEDDIPLDTAGADESGPSAAHAVNLASGVYENLPGPDVMAHNLYGDDPVFARRYRTANAAIGYSSPGLPLGWTHNYDLYVTGTPGSWSTLQFNYPNGATESWTPTLNGGTPTGAFTLPSGTPYLLQGTPSGTVGQWTSLVLTLKDESQWTFQPSGGNPNEYLLMQIKSITGSYLSLNYDTSSRLSSIQDDGNQHGSTVHTLLSFAYNNTGGTISGLTDNSDPANPRRIDYTTVTSNGIICLGAVSGLYQSGVDTPITRWQYGYSALISGIPFLNSVTTPKPDGTAGSDISAISYDPNVGTALTLLDSNLNTQSYNYSSNISTSIQVIEANHSQDTNWIQQFDGSNKATSDTDARQNVENQYYNDPNNPLLPTSFVNRNGQTVTIHYDPGLPYVGNISEIDETINNAPLATKLQYDTLQFSLGRLKQITVGSKTPTNISYYTVSGGGGIPGMVQSASTPKPGSPSGSGQQVTTTYTYTSLGNVSTIAVPAPDTTGRQVTYTYNYTDDPPGTHIQNEALGEPVTVTDPLNHITHYRWNPRGTLQSVTDQSGNQTSFLYNSNDQVTQVTFPYTGQGAQSSVLKYSYAYLGGPLLSANLYYEDGTLERTLNVTPGLEGEVKQQGGDAEKASATYNALYMALQLQDGDGSTHTTSMQYDLLTNLSFLNYPNVNTATHFDQMEGHLYDPDHNLETFVDGLNRVTTFTWANAQNGDDHLESITFPSGTLPTRTFSYDNYGRVTEVQEGSGMAANTYEYSYDDLDNITQVITTYSNVAGTAQLPEMQLNYAFNHDGTRSSLQLTESTNSYQFSYHYDDADRLTQETLPWSSFKGGSETLTFAYYANGWLQTQSNSLVNSSYFYNNTGFQSRGFLTELDNYPSNDGNNPAALSTFKNGQYDASGNLTSLTWNVPSQGSLPHFAPALANNATVTYQYKDANLHVDYLTQEISQRNSVYNASYTNGYGADNADNLALGSLGLSYNYDNQLTNTGYQYDGDGNPTQYPCQLVPSGNSTLTLTYDAEDRLTAFGSYFTAGYRPDGRRAWKQSAGNITHFLYDGDHLLAEFDDSGNLKYLYAWGAAGLAERSISNGYYAYTYDPSGNLVQRHSTFGRTNYLPKFYLIDYTAAYDAFGAQLGAIDVYDDQEESNLDNVGFGGQWGYYTDNETAGYTVPTGISVTRMPLVLCGLRYYDPQVGRFLTRDPEGSDGGINLYAYTRNNPINFADPLGTDWLDWVQGGADLIGLIPIANVPCEIISGGISLYKHDYVGASLSGVGLVPLLGDEAIATKLARRGHKIVEFFAEAKEARSLTKDVKRGDIIILERYGSKEEAEASKAAGRLLQKPGHPNAKKWIGELNTVDPRRLGQSKNYTHGMLIYVRKEALSWLQDEANAERKANELGRYGIHAHKLDEFNSFVKKMESFKR